MDMVSGLSGDWQEGHDSLLHVKERTLAAERQATEEYAAVDAIRARIRAAGFEPADDKHQRTQEIESVKTKLREVDRKLRLEQKRLDRAVG